MIAGGKRHQSTNFIGAEVGSRKIIRGKSGALGWVSQRSATHRQWVYRLVPFQQCWSTRPLVTLSDFAHLSINVVIVRVPVTAYHSPMVFTKLSKAEVAKYGLERRKASAYHEAGHAAVLFFLGSRDEVQFIDMVGNRKNSAFIRRQGFSPTSSVSLLQNLPPNIQRMFVTHRIMFDLAGAFAEDKLKPAGLDMLSLLDELDCNHSGHDADENCCDYGTALAAARIVYPDSERGAYRFLNTVARWTTEAIAEPRLWRVVEAVAARLLRARRISGETAFAIADKAWGESTRCPMLKSDRKWKRRLVLKLQPNRASVVSHAPANRLPLG